MKGSRKKYPWWVWLFIVLFPIPIGIAPWWVTVIFGAIFVFVLWGIIETQGNSSG